MYCLRLIESALETIMDDGYGKHFKQFSNEEKQEVINAVIKAFDDDNMFILRDKYVTTGKSGVLSAEDFKITKWQPIETAPLDSGMPHYFLVYTSHENTLMACGMEGELTYLTFMDGISFDTNCYGKPTHWMPLPNPPAE